MLQPGDPFILHKTYSPSGRARGQSIRKEFGRSLLEAVGLAQEENGMRMAAQISRRLSFFCHGKCDSRSSWEASLQRKNSPGPQDCSALQGKLQNVGPEPSLMFPTLEQWGRVREEPTWPSEAAATTEGQLTYTSLASSTLRVPGIFSSTT